MSADSEGIVYVYVDGAQEGTVVDTGSLGQVLQLAGSQPQKGMKYTLL